MEKVRTFGRLKERIKQVFGTQQAFADAMGMDKSTANLKLNNRSEWTYGEMEKICLIFGIDMNEIAD